MTDDASPLDVAVLDLRRLALMHARAAMRIRDPREQGYANGAAEAYGIAADILDGTTPRPNLWARAMGAK